MMSSESFHPIQLKGEIMDLEFNVDTDHRSVFILPLDPLINILLSIPDFFSQLGRGGETGQHRAV
jgi:hypothetical protein